MFEDLEESKKELSKSLQETKRSLKRSNIAVRELFEKYSYFVNSSSTEKLFAGGAGMSLVLVLMLELPVCSLQGLKALNKSRKENMKI